MIDRETLEIEIVEVNPIADGVEVFARAWSNKKQIGFGKDGTVDIERFLIHNPPVLVDDPAGDIIVDDPGDEERGVPPSVRRLREDPEASLLDSITTTMDVMTNLHDDSRIIVGKRGNTTSTFYPAAGANSPVDGYAYRQVSATSWAGIRDGNGTHNSTTVANNNVVWVRTAAASPNFLGLLRSFYAFDTSAIDTDEISSATLSIYGTSVEQTLTGQAVSLVAGTLANTNNIVNSDYQGTVGNVTKFASDINVASWNTSGFNNFALNASGIAHINKTGVSIFSGRHKADVEDVAPTHPGAQRDSIANGYFADQTGTSNDPKLVVEHSAAAPVANNGFMLWWA